MPVGMRINARRFEGKIRRVEGLLDEEAVLRLIGLRLLNWIGKNLRTAGADGVGLWHRMAPSTIRQRPQRQSPHHFSSRYQTLLQQSFVSVVNPASKTVRVGTQAKYAAFHHFGVPSRGFPNRPAHVGPNWRLPARPMLPSGPEARAMAVSVLAALKSRLRREGNG